MPLSKYFEKKDTNEKTEKKFLDDEEVCPNFYVKKKLYSKLMDHQKEGIIWLYNLFVLKKGAIFADDMGLGKTVQTITLISSLLRYSKIKRALIIMPTTLLINWKQEFKKWTDNELKIFIIDGKLSKNKRSEFIKIIQTVEGILLCTYGLALTLCDELSCANQSQKNSFFWDYLILDEAHRIKNQSKTTKALFSIPSKIRLAITGTPVQNNLSELWSIFNFTSQGTLLGSYSTFKRVYERPILVSREKDATNREKILGSKMAENLRKIYEPYFLRRTKEEIFGNNSKNSNTNMPNKYDWVIWIKMQPVQVKLYKDFLDLDEIKKVLLERNTKSPLVQLLVLKKICDHPRLISKNLLEKLSIEKNEDYDNLSEINISAEKLIKESGKLAFLNQLLGQLINENKKILIFSTSTKMLDIIEKILNMNKYLFLRLDGRINSNDKREEIVKKFQNNVNINILLLTIQVGGVGLTLTEASRVIIYDPNWNPGTDLQAVDRAFRIGQKNENVLIYRLVTCSSIEEKIYCRQVFKDSLNKQTVGKENDPTRYFTKDELFELFKYEDFNISKKCDEFNQIHGTFEEQIMKKLQENQEEIVFSQEQQNIIQHKEIIKKFTNLYDISEHSLLYTKKTEEFQDDLLESSYIEREVYLAQELLEKENNILPKHNLNSTKQKILHNKFGTNFTEFNFIPLGTNHIKNKKLLNEKELIDLTTNDKIRNKIDHIIEKEINSKQNIPTINIEDELIKNENLFELVQLEKSFSSSKSSTSNLSIEETNSSNLLNHEKSMYELTNDFERSFTIKEYNKDDQNSDGSIILLD